MEQYGIEYNEDVTDEEVEEAVRGLLDELEDTEIEE